jgi:hypothetical protein
MAEGMDLADMRKRSGVLYPKGTARWSLACMLERIDKEDPSILNHPEPRGTLDRINYRLLKLAMQIQDPKIFIAAVDFIHDRLDGKAPIAVEVSGEVEHRYVARTPSIEKSTEEWQKKYSPPIQ